MNSTKTKPISQEPQQVFSLLPVKFRHSREHVTIQDAAEALNVTDQHIRNLIDAGKLLSIAINPDAAAREHLRILRFTIEALWLEQYLLKNGVEFPCANSTQILWWRHELRKIAASSGAGAGSAPAASTNS